VLRRLFTVRGLVGLLLTLVAAVGMLWLGQWQLGRGETTHSVQNYAYAVEWVLFAAFAVFCFYKLVLAEDVEPDEPKVDVVLAPPRPLVDEPEDDELAAYNAYLAQLNAEQSP
jgi:DNA-binding transcriptional regulator of glucitol operon